MPKRQSISSPPVQFIAAGPALPLRPSELPRIAFAAPKVDEFGPDSDSNFTPLWGDETVFPLLRGLTMRQEFGIVLAGQEQMFKIKLGETPKALELGLNSKFDALCLLKCTPTYISLITQVFTA